MFDLRFSNRPICLIYYFSKQTLFILIFTVISHILVQHFLCDPAASGHNFLRRVPHNQKRQLSKITLLDIGAQKIQR